MGFRPSPFLSRNSKNATSHARGRFFIRKFFKGKNKMNKEPLTVTENHIQISNLKAGHETFDESNIYGELIMHYQLNNGEEYQDRFSLEQIHNHQLPNDGSILTKTYYKGSYVLRSGKTITLETADKLKKGDNIHRREDPEYQWAQITPHTEPINTSVRVPYIVSTGKTHMTHYRDKAYTINP